MDGKGHSDEVSDGNEDHVIGNRRKGDRVIKRQRAWLNCSSPGVLWKTELESDETGNSAEEALRQSVESTAKASLECL